MASNFNIKPNEESKTEWLTPPNIIKALGEFDLDPCAPINRPWSTAKNHFTIEDDGLKKEWFGRVWCNPPYSNKEITAFTKRMIEHNNGIMLIFARTDTKLWHDLIFKNASAFLFLKHRITFFHVTGEEADNKSGAASVLIAFGEQNIKSLEDCDIKGKILYNNKKEKI